MMSYLSPPSMSLSSSFSSSTSTNGGDCELRVAVMGAVGVGKSAIINQFIFRKFLRAYWTTMQERHMHNIEVNGKNVILDIYDTGGSKNFSHLRDLAITNSDAFVLVYSIDDESSFETIAAIRDDILYEKPAGVPLVVVANKTDLTNCTRFMSRDKAHCMVTVGWEHPYLETSAKDHESVCMLFDELVAQVSEICSKKDDRRRITRPAELLRSIKRKLKRSKTAQST